MHRLMGHGRTHVVILVLSWIFTSGRFVPFVHTGREILMKINITGLLSMLLILNHRLPGSIKMMPHLHMPLVVTKVRTGEL